GADRTFLQVWLPYQGQPQPQPQTLIFATSYHDFLGQVANLPTQRPSSYLDLILAYTEGDDDCYLGVVSPGGTAFTDFFATTDWHKFAARQRANASHALSDLKVYDRAGVRTYVGVWAGPSVAGTQSQFGDTVSTMNSFLAPLSMGSASMDTYRATPRWAGATWTQQIQSWVATDNPPGSMMGCAWAVGQGGSIIASGTQGLSRSAYEPQNPNQPFTLDSRIFLWSLTKLVTASALLHVLWDADSRLTKLGQPQLPKLDQPFLPDILPLMPAGFSPAPQASSLTIRHLLTYTSGLNGNAPLPSNPQVNPANPAFSYAAWTAWMLETPFLFTPGTQPYYFNVDLDMAAFLIGVYSAQSPAQYILKFLARLGVHNLNYTPDPLTDALQYANANDTVPGLLPGSTNLPLLGTIGGAALMGSARQYLKFLMGLRSSAYPRPLLQLMLCGDSGPKVPWPSATTAYQPEGPTGGQLAWDNVNIGRYGEFCAKNGGGGIGNNGLAQGASHEAFHFPGGYDAVMLTNSHQANGYSPIWNAFNG
ncbi:MAG TPA: serine hydrolase domain-containing protein, partial [Acidimicrobiales bacterium]|nr:serine hydrolase domain-containing protein [Acidimicrobiales bacterium]